MIKRLTFRFSLMLLLSGLGIMNSFAQEAFFAQYYASPMHLNPALVGVFDGQFRLNGNFRQQWGNTFASAPLRTTQAAFEYKARVMKTDFFSIGVNALNDETGSDARVKTTRSNVGISFQKQLNDSRYRGVTQYLSAGLQVGVGQHALNMGGLWFDRQYDSVAVAVNTSLSSGEVAPQSKMYLDYNLGLLFYTVWEENKSFYAGASLHHLTRPNISFYGNLKEQLRRRVTFHTGGEIPINEDLSVLPTGMITLQGPSMWASMGANIRYSNHNWTEAAIRAGAALRLANRYISETDKEGKSVQKGTGILSDAVTLTGILELNRIMLGVSFDLHASTIKLPTNSRGAWEISIIYTGAERRRIKTECPKF